MKLYSTALLIESIVIPYDVYKEGSRIFFKPLKANIGINAPIFWVSQVDGIWKPINIDDEKFIKQIQEDIQVHQV